MLRKESEAVPEGNGPVPQQDEFGSGQPTLVDALRKIKEALGVCHRRFDKMEKYVDDLRSMGRRVAGLEPGARQPRFAIEADGPANTKTRERTEGAATAVQAMHGDSCTAQRVQDGSTTNSTSFGMMAEPPDLPCREDVLVENGDRRPNRVSHPWRCAQQQPPVAYFPPAKFPQQRRPPSISRLFSST